MSERYQGSCLCAAIGYELLATPKAVSHCHCSQCRKGEVFNMPVSQTPEPLLPRPDLDSNGRFHDFAQACACLIAGWRQLPQDLGKAVVSRFYAVSVGAGASLR